MNKRISQFIIRNRGPGVSPTYGRFKYIDGLPGALVKQVIELLRVLDVLQYDGTWIRPHMTWQYVEGCILGEMPEDKRRKYRERNTADDIAWLAKHVGPASEAYFTNTADDTAAILNCAAQVAALSKDTNMQNQYDPQTGTKLPQPYESRIKTGNELEVGKRYRLEVVGGKNPPDIAEPGKLFAALGNSEGVYTGEVVDLDTMHTFNTDASDLWIRA